MKRKKEFVIYNETYKTSIVCVFNMKTKDIIKVLKTYKDTSEFIRIAKETEDCDYCYYDKLGRYLLVMEEFDNDNLEHMSSFVHETHHLTQMNWKRINSTDLVEYGDLEPPAYYHESIFREILDKYLS